LKVEGSKSTSSVQGAARARKAGSVGAAGAFASELDNVGGVEEASGPDSVENVSGMAGVAGILAAQSVDPDGQADHRERQRRAQRGSDMLDRLEDIRRGLLLGVVPKDRLQELAHMVREKRERGADPVISRLLDEIELRAEVELAKLSRRIP
jgi:hypothetical protein